MGHRDKQYWRRFFSITVLRRAHAIVAVHMTYKRLIIMTVISAHIAAPALVRAAVTDETSASPQRIGIYDSRVVAYAHFWTPQNQQQLNEKMKTATAAKASSDTAQFNKLSKELADEQQRLHRQVFSIAPADEAMAALEPRLADIQNQASVSALVSKWDKQALGSYKSAQQADVTDLLVREFKLEPKQIKTIEEIKKQKPVPLEKIDKLHDD
jgi:hypothetical protein